MQCCENIIEETLKNSSFQFLGWRNVSTDNSSLGELAEKAQPVIKQFFVTEKDVQAFSDEF